MGGHDGARRYARDAHVAAAQRDPQGAHEAVAEPDRRDAVSHRRDRRKPCRQRERGRRAADRAVGRRRSVRGRRARRQRPLALRLHLAAHRRAHSRRHAQSANLPGVLRRAADRRRGRHDSESHERHAGREKRSREDRLGRPVAVAVGLRDHGRSAHAHLQLPVQQLDGARASVERVQDAIAARLAGMRLR